MRTKEPDSNHGAVDRRESPEPSRLSGLTEALELGPANAAVDPLLGKDFGGVRLVRLIAEGGMGRVYEGLQDRPRRPVAIKVMRPGFISSEACRRFDNEAEVLGRLRHQYIAQIFSAGICDIVGAQVPYFVMEFIPDALPLTKYAAQCKLTVDQRLALFRKVCDAVAHGHEKGVIHRDLKPSNILVEPSGDPKIIDFGVARCIDASPEAMTALTDMGQLIGTLQYMSPEQFVANPAEIDVRSDVYALGVILYELLTGRPPYELRHKQIFEAARVVREHKPVSPAKLNTSVRPDVAKIAGRCLHKNRSQRYANAAELATAIGSYLSGQPLPITKRTVFPEMLDLTHLWSRLASWASAFGRLSAGQYTFMVTAICFGTILLLGTRLLLHEFTSLTPPNTATLNDGESQPAVTEARNRPPVPTLAKPPSLAKSTHDSVTVGQQGFQKDIAQVVERNNTTSSSHPPLPPAANQPLNVVQPSTGTLTNSIGIRFTLCPSGTFVMGDARRGEDERPPHIVEFTNPFYVGITEVTNAEWKRVMGYVPSQWKDDDKPVENITWHEANDFCRKLSALPEERNAGRVYRLPTEAEWEYACRAGTTTQFPFGDDVSRLSDYGWCGINSNGQTHTAGQRKPNAWGLHDMQGNVWEWVNDGYDAGYYAKSPRSNPQGPAETADRVHRGGGWRDSHDDCRPTLRRKCSPSFRHDGIGFRLALNFPAGSKETADRGTPNRLTHATPSVSLSTTRDNSTRLLPDSQADVKALAVIENSIGMKLIQIPAGTFRMGPRTVRITRPFYLGQTEVTNEQWKKIMGNALTQSRGDHNPAGSLRWDDSVTFCRKLSMLPDERAAGRVYRLPTEAEWEYACRAGASTTFSFGDDASLLGEHAWFRDNSDLRSHPVGQKQPNAWGLYDMHGNVWEWCQDWFGPFDENDTTDPHGPLQGVWRINRGGSWDNDAGSTASSRRSYNGPSGDVLHETIGLRVAMAVSSQSTAPVAGQPQIPAGSQAHAVPGSQLSETSPPALAITRNEDILAIPPLTNSVRMKLKLLPAGTFLMGDDDGRDAEQPRHQVTIRRPFYLGIHEVTNAQWRRVMGQVPSDAKDEARPVEKVSWHDAVSFCRKLSDMPAERTLGHVYRLPTEAEWEYACRAGTTTQYAFGNDEGSLGDYAWFAVGGNSAYPSNPVGQKKPNPWGLFDMHGNVWEWCSDWYGDYDSNAVTDPQGPAEGTHRVKRGGGWYVSASGCRSAIREFEDPARSHNSHGFRIAMNVAESSSVSPPPAASKP